MGFILSLQRLMCLAMIRLCVSQTAAVNHFQPACVGFESSGSDSQLESTAEGLLFLAAEGVSAVRA